MSRHIVCKTGLALAATFLFACTTTRHVGEGELLLSTLTVKCDNSEIAASDMKALIKQQPNSKTFEILKIPLYIYDWSAKDTANHSWINRTLRSAGEPPVIYSAQQAQQAMDDIEQELNNRGYYAARVRRDSVVKDKKLSLNYFVETGKPYIVNNYDTTVFAHLDSLFEQETAHRSTPAANAQRRPEFSITGMLASGTMRGKILSIALLDAERDRITSILRDQGYYDFTKDYISFEADTTRTSYSDANTTRPVDLKLIIKSDSIRNDTATSFSHRKHRRYTIGNVEFLMFSTATASDSNAIAPPVFVETDPVDTRITYAWTEVNKNYLKRDLLFNNSSIRPGTLYRQTSETLTRNSLTHFPFLRYINISYEKDTLSNLLHCKINCLPDKLHSFKGEIEGTHTSGIFGIGAGVGYTHHNLFKGSQTLDIGLNGMIEQVSKNTFSNPYYEIDLNATLSLPSFPLLDSLFQKLNHNRRIFSTTQLPINISYQNRPSYFERIVYSGGLRYNWNNRRNSNIRQTIDLIDMSMVKIRSIDPQFKNSLDTISRIYSFEDHLIVGAGYTYYNSNYDLFSTNRQVHTTRISIESAGNLLAGIAAIAGIERNLTTGSKEFFGTAYSQYVRGSFDYSSSLAFDAHNSFAWHIGAGLAFPYGNNALVPIQKRFFSGGANSVRGWAVRELGPGSYYSPGNNFYYHSGDIRFDANIEYRGRALSMLEIAAFLDAGNIWTCYDYQGQQGGKFALNTFYRQIAFSWGLGFRIDIKFVLLRFDLGLKIYDPADNPAKDHWRVQDPLNFSDNAAFHFAIGYPF